MPAIVAEKLNKIYDGGVHALKDLDLTVERGSVFGFLGPNGSGKTTTVRLLNGTLIPSAGTVRVLEMAPDEESARLKISTLAETARMYDTLTPLENLRFYAGLYGIDGSEREGKIRSLLSMFELWEKRDLKLGTFSTGMQKRVELARTLLNDPEILFLDEPTSGLDPETSLQVTDLISTLAREEKRTIFMCTHNLALAERSCDRFGFIHQGKLVGAGTQKELTINVGAANHVRISTSAGSYRLPCADERQINVELRRLMDKGEYIRDVHLEAPDLEAVYFHYVRRNAGESA